LPRISFGNLPPHARGLRAGLLRRSFSANSTNGAASSLLHARDLMAELLDSLSPPAMRFPDQPIVRLDPPRRAFATRVTQPRSLSNVTRFRRASDPAALRRRLHSAGVAAADFGAPGQPLGRRGAAPAGSIRPR